MDQNYCKNNLLAIITRVWFDYRICTYHIRCLAAEFEPVEADMAREDE